MNSIYQSSLTKEIIVTIIMLLLFWIINMVVILNTNGIRDAVVASILIFIFAIAFVSAFVKGIYVKIENNTVKYVHMFVLRRSVDIEKINKVQRDLMGGLYTSLSLIYEENGKPKDIKVLALTFKKDTLKQFISDLKKQNPKIIFDQSATELVS